MLLKVFLPLSLAFIMFSLGLGLTLNDFKRVATEPGAFALGALNQMIFLPLVAGGIALAFALPAEFAVGLMILSFSPGGVTSNVITKFARGDMALSISLTAVVSVLSIVTVPLFVALSMEYFMGSTPPEFSVSKLGTQVLLLVSLPVGLGMLVKAKASAFAKKFDPIAEKVSGLLFVVIVIGAIATNWQVLVTNLPKLAPSLVTLNIAMLVFGFFSAKLLGLGSSRATSISIETGIQNATVGITVGSLVIETASALPPFSLPSAVYGITMYVVSLPFIYWLRRQNAPEAAPAEDKGAMAA